MIIVMKILVGATVVVLAIAGFVQWTHARDGELYRAAMAYERCVVEQYGMTPVQWYSEQGKYPRCGN